MPDTLNPTIPDGSSPENVFDLFKAAEAATDQPQSEQAQVQAEPVQAPAAKAPEKPAGQPGDIPEQFLTIKKEAAAEPQQEDEFDTLMKTEPQGQLKHDDWKRYKTAVSRKVESLNAQLKERDAKLQEAEKRGVPEDIAKKLEQYEKTLAEREAVLERIAVQESPKFKQQYTVKETAIQERLKRSGAELGLDVEALDLALKGSPKRRAEILDQLEMGETTRSMLSGLMNQYDLLQDDKAEFLNQSKEVHARMQEEERAVAAAKEEQRSAFEKQVFTKIGDEIRKSYAPFQRVEGNDAWNAQAEAMEAEAEKYFNGQLPLEDLARVVYKGVGAQAQERIISALHQKLGDATKELESLKRAQPGSSGYVPHSNGAPDDRHLHPDQRAMNTWDRFVVNPGR